MAKTVRSFAEFTQLVKADMEAQADRLAEAVAVAKRQNLRPHRVTGELEQSIRIETTGAGERVVIADADHAEAIEQRYPFARPAVEAVAARAEVIAK